jgi:hypothetical protein
MVFYSDKIQLVKNIRTKTVGKDGAGQKRSWTKRHFLPCHFHAYVCKVVRTEQRVKFMHKCTYIGTYVCTYPCTVRASPAHLFFCCVYP